MSDIKNVPGPVGGPGGVDETQREEPQSTERSARFRKVARRMREKKIAELEAAVKGGAPPGNTSGANSSGGILDAILRKTQIQGQPINTPVSNPNAPAVAPGPQAPDLKGLFGPPPNTNVVPLTGPSTPGSTGPSLLSLFGGGGKLKPAATPPPAAPAFRPTFQTGVANINTATGNAAPLNPMFFATPETTEWLITQKLPQIGYPGATAVLKNSLSNGGPFVANQQELWIQLPNGTQINAGFIADYYRRNPEDKFPGLADKYVKSIIDGEIQAQAGKGIQS